jgi:polyprenyl-phospho-N-acetylgalactosaminyl synthase
MALTGVNRQAQDKGNRGIFIVIPAYNEAKTVGGVVREIIGLYPNVIVVDDGSPDSTVAEARAAGAVVLKHVLNRGQGAALKTGIDFALLRRAEIIVTFDADGQHRAADIAALTAPVAAGACEVALGSRFLESAAEIPLFRRLTLKAAILFTRLVSGIRVTDTHNGFRAFSRKAAEQIQIRQDRMAHASEILDEICRLKLPFREVPTRIFYTEYSRGKGQRFSASLRIVWDFFIGKSER